MPESAAGTDPHVARELHDQVAQPLVELVLRLHEVRTAGFDGALFDDLEDIEDSARQILKQTREMLIDLRGQGHIRLRFVDALRSELSATRPGLGRLTPTVHVSSRWPRLMNAWAAFNLLRIVKEAVANAVLHGRAERVDVFLDADGRDEAVIEVVDDGIGIHDTPFGFGMQGMAERAVILGGTLRAANHEAGGTRVEVRVPRHRVE